MTQRALWTRPFGSPPVEARWHQAWFLHLRTVAAYRDRYGITAGTPLDPAPATPAQRLASPDGPVTDPFANRLNQNTPPARPRYDQIFPPTRPSKIDSPAQATVDLGRPITHVC